LSMNRVGAAIRAAYHWIPITHKCYLVMDNARGAWNSRRNFLIHTNIGGRL